MDARDFFGVVIMMVSDGQKYFTLKYRSGLITEGMFKRVRHPNYAGEMMIYAAYALLVQHWLPWVVLAYWWSSIFFALITALISLSLSLLSSSRHRQVEIVLTALLFIILSPRPHLFDKKHSYKNFVDPTLSPTGHSVLPAPPAGYRGLVVL